MAVEERDPHTGFLTTGHIWNGIKELNTPVPRAIYWFLAAAFLFGVVYWVLMPAWPIGTTYTKGLLGIDQRRTVAVQLERAVLARADWSERIRTESFAAIQADPALMATVRATGHRLFGDNCAACHGAEGRGGKGFPNLAGGSWLWGGAPEQIAETIRVGINSAHPDSRVSQMPAFGRDQMLTRPEIEAVVSYVRGLSDPAPATDQAAERAAGAKLFAANCAACHGPAAKGMIEMGAPDLSDRIWLYGGDLQSVFTTVWGGRQGQMPTWESRLSEVDRKILTLFVAGLHDAKP